MSQGLGVSPEFSEASGNCVQRAEQGGGLGGGEPLA